MLCTLPYPNLFVQVRELHSHIGKVVGKQFHLDDMLNPESETPFRLAAEDMDSFLASVEGIGYNPAATQHLRLAGIGSWLVFVVGCIKSFQSESLSAMATKEQMLTHLKSLKEDVWGEQRLKKLEKNAADNTSIIHNLEEKVYHREASRVVSFKEMLLEFQKSAHYIQLHKRVTSGDGGAAQLSRNSRDVAGLVYVHSGQRAIAICSLKVGDFCSRNYLYLPHSLADLDTEAQETDYVRCPLASNGHPFNAPNEDTHRCICHFNAD